MQFLVLGFDGFDDDAPSRRQRSRPAHIARGEELLAAGNLWYGAALLDDNKAMIGSMYMMDFSNRAELDEYFETEPYVIGDVWQKIEVSPCITREPWQFNRPEQFFNTRH